MALVPDNIAQLRAYEAGRSIEEIQQLTGLDRIVKLASNENPLGTSPMAMEAIRRTLAQPLNRYPDGGLGLRRALAARYSMKPENVIVASGSESLIGSILRTFLCDDDEVLTTESAFIGFQCLAQSRGVAYRTVPYRDYHYDLDALAAAITVKTKIIYLANPNNPTGTIFTRQEFERFHQRVPSRVLILLDEAYFEYAASLEPEFPDSLGYRFDNVITLRTFSKAYGLAGLRLGYGFAHEELIANLLKVKLPFEPSSLALAAGTAALDDRRFLEETLECNKRSLAALVKGFEAQGCRVAPSYANFVMVALDSAAEAAALTRLMLERGIIVRPLAAVGLPHAIRISTGTMEETEICLAALPDCLSAIRKDALCHC